MMAVGGRVHTVTHNEAPASAAQDVVHLQQPMYTFASTAIVFTIIPIHANFTAIVFIIILSNSLSS